MTEYEEIRLVDLFESAMERPYLYTLHGTYQEAISYLEGCYNGFTRHRLNEDRDTSLYALDLQCYRSFASWLAEKHDLSSDKEAFRRLGEQAEHPLEAVLKLYREFKRTV